MATKSKTVWVNTRRNIQRAQALVAKYAADKVHPDEFIPAPQPADWDELLGRIK